MTPTVKFTLLLWLLVCRALPARAEVFILDSENRDSVIGELSYVIVKEGETLVDIARRYDLGYDELIKANPHTNRWVPEVGERVILPTMHILPDNPREGIVLNLAELRVYFFPVSTGPGFKKVYTYPISIGRMDWKSPLGLTKVVKKEVEPAWYPPASIQAEHLSEGEVLPKMIPGGVAENPLGHFALRLGIPSYLIHGTDERKEYGIGMRVTHGCIRMYPEDIEQLYSLAPVNTPVYFIDQPVKAGWKGSSLFVEVTTPLREDREEFEEYSHRVDLEEIVQVISRKAPEVEVETELLLDLIRVGDGIPVKVARLSSGLPPPRE